VSDFDDAAPAVTDLTVGDVITTIDGKAVKNKQESLRYLNTLTTGDVIARSRAPRSDSVHSIRDGIIRTIAPSSGF
jgi:PDZ domain-containing secreted protein